MDINDFITTVESQDDIVDRCVLYSEAIIHLKNVRVMYYFQEGGVPWKNDINDKLIMVMHKEVDDTIAELRKMIKLNLDINQIK